MRLSRNLLARRFAPVLATLLAASFVDAQEGFPLDGTWRGEWGSGNVVVIAMEWDGERIEGMINPGPRAVPFTSAVLEPETWTVRIEAQGADSEPIRIEGQLKDIGSYNRYVEGTWTVGSERYPFKITRE
ncbi:MAG TPA: hypothetical protein VF329_04165 [Gammaproteobacteria bacterium]